MIEELPSHSFRLERDKDGQQPQQPGCHREAGGGRLEGVTGSHHHFKHPERPGKVTIPHPQKDMPIGTVKSIERQSGVKLR